MENTKIEWATHTFNPWRGCTKVSPGCANCYAETLSRRNPDVLGEWGPTGKRVIAAESYWQQPRRWNQDAQRDGARHRVFCASLADVFEDRPELDEPRARLFNLIKDTPHLDWLLLTKRPQNIEPLMRHIPVLKRDNLWEHLWLSHDGRGYTRHFSNVWLGVSVEDQERADERIPLLLAIPAKVHFLSCEPLLGMIRLDQVENTANLGEGQKWLDSLGGRVWESDSGPEDFYDITPTGGSIDWVIAGGESGANARPMHPDWARSLRDQCQAAGVPFFFKQWGEFIPSDEVPGHIADEYSYHRNGSRHPAVAVDGVVMVRVGKKDAGRQLDNREWDEVPQS